jgi:hypothetical protein
MHHLKFKNFVKIDPYKNHLKSVNYLGTHLHNDVKKFVNIWIHKPLPLDFDIWKDKKLQLKLIQHYLVPVEH